jgi:adenosylcobinamide kinase/adenosylcobinamide-phosphate guanylyltransferase
MKNSQIILILGGARSGKSQFALSLGGKMPGQKIFVATAEALDAEMAERIHRHREMRSKEWKTVEEPIHLCDLLAIKSKDGRLILIDCLTLWLSNLLQKDENSKTIEIQINRLIESLKKTERNVILVSNEVGWGIVPDNPLSRKFRDLTGLMNQKVAETADTVYLVSAGIPVRIK